MGYFWKLSQFRSTVYSDAVRVESDCCTYLRLFANGHFEFDGEFNCQLCGGCYFWGGFGSPGRRGCERGAAPAEGGDVSGDSIFSIRVHDEA